MFNKKPKETHFQKKIWQNENFISKENTHQIQLVVFSFEEKERKQIGLSFDKLKGKLILFFLCLSLLFQKLFFLSTKEKKKMS